MTRSPAEVRTATGRMARSDGDNEPPFCPGLEVSVGTARNEPLFCQRLEVSAADQETVDNFLQIVMDKASASRAAPAITPVKPGSYGHPIAAPGTPVPPGAYGHGDANNTTASTLAMLATFAATCPPCDWPTTSTSVHTCACLPVSNRKHSGSRPSSLLPSPRLSRRRRLHK